MKDFVPLGTGNSRFLKSVANFLTLYPDYASFAAALVAGTLPVDFNGINTAGIAQSGTPLNKSALLTDETAAALGLTGDDPTINEALAVLAPILSTAQVVVGSYTGTGVYGASNPCSLTFEKAPKAIILMSRESDSISDGDDHTFAGMVSIQSPDSTANTKQITAHIIPNTLTTEYKQGYGFSFGSSYSSGNFVASLYTSYAKKSADGRTVYWYNSAAAPQCNISGNTYHYMAIL